MDKNLTKIIKDISEELDIPQFKIELVVMSQFQTVRDIIKQGELESIGLMHFGTFHIHKNRKSKIIENRDAKRTKSLE